jgi:hypothetical protein
MPTTKRLNEASKERMSGSGMALGGIDPSIVRELSGVYKPIVKAIKEFVSNAFDADAEHVRVQFANDFSSFTVTDDGVGMTPFEFRNDFTRIGGGSRRWAGDTTRKGRLRIGNKGIGFLALARYCAKLQVESSGTRTLRSSIVIPKTPANLDLSSVLGVPIDPELLAKRITVRVLPTGKARAALKSGRDYKLDLENSRLSIKRATGPVLVNIEVDCKGLGFRATLDFDSLLELADKVDLEKLDQFACITVFELDADIPVSETRISAIGIKGFVQRDLRAGRRKGFVRNIASRSGLEQFVWHLSRSTPIEYEAFETANADIQAILSVPGHMYLRCLEVGHADHKLSLRRPVYPLIAESPPLPDDMLVPVHLNEGGVEARGFLAAYESVIFPAEYRGVTIRVRGVAIGDSGFLGAENLLTGADRAALSQITGEINILSGLDAVDTLNPGRESFYEESEHYKVLRRCLIGEGEQVGGLLRKAVAAVLRRSQVNSAVTDVLGRAALRRRALDDVAAAITHVVSHGAGAASGIRRMLKSHRSHVNGLPSSPDFEFSLPPHIAGLEVVRTENLARQSEINYSAGRIMIDTNRPEWDPSILVFDKRFDVLHKKGAAHQPIAELDLKQARIFVNWGHPARVQMDERGFLRTALAWVLAKEAADGDADQMMDLALNLLSFTTQGDG